MTLKQGQSSQEVCSRLTPFLLLKGQRGQKPGEMPLPLRCFRFLNQGPAPFNVAFRWNALTHIFHARKRPGRFATVSVWAETLPVFYLPAWREALPEVFYTPASLVEEKAMRGIRAVVEHPELQGLPLEPAPPGSTRLICVATPIVPRPDFQLRARRIDQALEAWRARTDPDLSIQYASIAAPMPPDTQEAPIFVVLLQPLKATTEEVDALALGAPAVPEFLSGPRRPRQIAARAAKKVHGGKAT